MKFHILLPFVLYVYQVNCKLEDTCRLQTCGECISSKDNCVWCAQGDLEDNYRRCLPRNSHNIKKKSCDSKFIKSAEPEARYTTDKSFSDTINGIKVQLRPQRMYIKARPGVRVPFTFAFEPAKDYPLDIYYLMDISFTMQSSKIQLRNQALTLYKRMTDYTNNVRLGIGSFVEKPGFPFVDENMKKPHNSHAFKNLLSLTTEVNDFYSAIDAISFGANYDDPESGLDAIMQVMKCQKELGWRPGALKIIVLCTDATYHSAGDGKIIGAIKPNDMNCHLRNNTYDKSMSLTYDYPSISQINYLVRNENFIIVFAVKEKVKTVYEQLAKQILGASYAKLEGGDSAVRIIKDVYLQYAQKVLLDFTFPSFIYMSLDPDCKKKPQTDACKSTPEQRTITINGELEVKYCPKDEKLTHELEVKVVGLNDKLIINLDITCHCDCEGQSGNLTSKCHYAGFEQCGICKCKAGSYGFDCRCNGTSTHAEDNKKCFMNSDDKMWCSGKGECNCGTCECNEGYSGIYCEFNDFSCPTTIKNDPCSGKGNCKLGKCVCDAQWSGEDCSCLLSTSACTAPYSDQICSGNGICKCGNCECSKLDGKNETYSGQYCDACDKCAEKRCKELAGYVVCNVMNKKQSCDKIHKTNNTIVTFVNKTEINGPKWELAKWCKTQLENDSYVIFKYQYNGNELELAIQNETELPEKANMLVAVGSAIGIALLIGIITLIVWKVLIDIHDKREYQKFIEEAESAGYQNVLYVPPTQQFSNPAFEND